VVVGHSVGGFYAEAFARLYPHRTRALLLLDSSIAADHRPRLALPVGLQLVAADAAATLLNKLHLRTLLIRAGLALVQRRRPGGLDAQMRSEICSAAADPDVTAALLTEYVRYHELAAELFALRARSPLPAAVRRMVVTAHTGWHTHRWRAQQIKLARTLGAEHVIVAPAGHLVMIEKPLRTADLIRSLAGAA
jgi:pimeloyl-ACP methyl ester carboxylesterase